MKALDIVMETAKATLPDGSPLPFVSVRHARFEPPNKSQIVAEVEMFDGLPAKMRLRLWGLGWSLGWDEMAGGDCSLENGGWVRVDRATLTEWKGGEA
jgi:hypothetical protein